MGGIIAKSDLFKTIFGWITGRGRDKTAGSLWCTNYIISNIHTNIHKAYTNLYQYIQ